MLYTNTILEIFETEFDRRAELGCVYGHSYYVPVRRGNLSKISLLKHKFNNNISLGIGENKNIELIDDEKGKDLYILLDLLDYKQYSANSKLLTLEGNKDFEVLKFYKCNNRTNRRSWGMYVLKANNLDFSILKMVTTSGEEKYLSIINGIVKISPVRETVKFLINSKIPKSVFDIKEDKWELLKRK